MSEERAPLKIDPRAVQDLRALFDASVATMGPREGDYVELHAEDEPGGAVVLRRQTGSLAMATTREAFETFREHGTGAAR